MSDIHEDDEIESVGDEPSFNGSDDTIEASTPADDCAKYKKDYLYLAAEFENYKKNAIKERSQLLKYGSERLIREVLEVIDNFERALEITPNSENVESFAKGMELIHTELLSSLGKFGVSASNAKGLPFDPNEHEALSSEPTSEVEPGHVFRVFKKAYRLHDRLIRPAQVVVATELQDASAENSTSDGSEG